MWELTSLKMNYLISLLTVGYSQVVAGQLVVGGGGGWGGGGLPVLSYRGAGQGYLPVPGIVQPASTSLLQLLQPQQPFSYLPAGLTNSFPQPQQNTINSEQEDPEVELGLQENAPDVELGLKENVENTDNGLREDDENVKPGLQESVDNVEPENVENVGEGKPENSKAGEGASKVRIGIEFPLTGVEKQLADHQSEPCCDGLTSNTLTLSKDSAEGDEIGDEQDVSTNTIEDFETEIVSENVKCVKKIMMEEKYEYDTEVTCDHSYSKTCYTSLVTTYSSSQEEECQEDYVKECFIDYNKAAEESTIVVCRKELVKDCGLERSGLLFPLPGTKTQASSSASPPASAVEGSGEVCRTHHQTECVTRSEEHLVTEDSPVCKTVEEVKCEDSRDNSTCVSWPRNVCSIERKEVKRVTPTTECSKVPVELCGPPSCSFRESEEEQCEDRTVTLVRDKPEETCDLQPRRVCNEVEQCTEVPREVCTKSRASPRKVKHPVLKKWCYHVNRETTTTPGPGYGRNLTF